ncbi:toll/interleukin-1 receptor domain-containing protein [Aquimarina sp. AU474]|uniref:toll/interleukin-1 receptor domain-containing protein n=1 Tax=Aquimarina sp. AU474 TaxID=2108529 RepID=UPI000D686C83|nr:toll/interleukin-1 receptor domain-containing protein [Aquimarina sp. AU474]
MSKRQGVFISYSKKDAKWLDYLRTHLSYLERKYEFTIWEDSRIEAGADWRSEIHNAINNTKVAVLLVSANFISSEFIGYEELPALLSMAKDEGANIFIIIVSHCMFSDIDAISKFQAINAPSEPLVSMTEGQRDALFVKVTREIKKVLASNTHETLLHNSGTVTTIDDLRTSFLRVLIMNIFYNNTNDKGLSIKDVYVISKIEKRKYVVKIIHELETSEIIYKTKVNKVNHYKLTEFGYAFMKEHNTQID